MSHKINKTKQTVLYRKGVGTSDGAKSRGPNIPAPRCHREGP